MVNSLQAGAQANSQAPLMATAELAKGVAASGARPSSEWRSFAASLSDDLASSRFSSGAYPEPQCQPATPPIASAKRNAYLCARCAASGVLRAFPLLVSPDHNRYTCN